MRPVTGTDLRDVTVRDYKRAAERAGMPIDLAEIERQATADCETYDAVRRAVVPTGPAAPDPAKEQEKADELDRQAADAGATIIRDQRKIVRKKLAALHATPKPGSRWSLALGRIARIVSGATPSTDRRKLVSTCEIPALAWEVMRIQAYVVTRHVPPRFGDEINPFYGLSTRDFTRKFQRMIEDVADQSTGKLGPWFVPK